MINYNLKKTNDYYITIWWLCCLKIRRERYKLEEKKDKSYHGSPKRAIFGKLTKGNKMKN
jgi:hypothetical protein